ncbi:MAG: flagellar biosynthesis protein FlhA [Phycisphaerae bacterium]|nr:flagellar biosynthesis protein FlhA [Phycisphaerae bacterium]
MAEVATPPITISAIVHMIAEKRHLVVPIGFLAMIGVLVVPMPAPAMDILICGNIAIAAVILMTTMYMKRPLDFSVFPALLLATTLFRLVINVASTRLILSTTTTDPRAGLSGAGHVIQAFANFVAGENPVVGGIIFLILVVVQFVVITKGATRMSEVAARFTLDAMPGKQMAIDADLSAGLINESDAKARRETVTREADFYGAMDGASKFVRGDAIAGIIITLINIIGGFAIAKFQLGWSYTDAIKVFTMLSIGDGLASQIPAFIIAISSGLIVARAGDGRTVGEEIPNQLASQPMALYLIAGFLVALSLTPLPSLPLLIAAGALAGIARYVRWNARQGSDAKLAAERALASSSVAPQPVEELLSVDVLEIEIGYGLVQLVDASRGGTLLERISAIRRQLAVEMGLVVPPVRIRDNMNVGANEYRVRIRGATIGDGTVYPDLLMAMDAGLATGRLQGVSAKEPAFGLEATWIETSMRSRAEGMNYALYDATSVVATHMTELVRRHADELLTREEIANLLAQLKTKSPKLVEETVPALVKPGELQKVLQALLRERVPIRDLESILETLADWVPHTRDVDVLVEYVRNALRRTICAQHSEPGDDGKPRLHCVTMDPAVEDVISGYIDRGPAGTTFSIPPRLAARIASATTEAAQSLSQAGRAVIVVAGPSVRAQVRQLLEPHVPGVVVLGYNEIAKGVDVESVGLIQLPLAERVGERAVAAAA